MSVIDLVSTATQLPETWHSQVFAMVGEARVKLSRMDATAYAEERHTHAEVLVVLDGQMNLVVEGVAIPVRAGEMVRVDAGALHGVAAGSHGALLIFNLPDAAAA